MTDHGTQHAKSASIDGFAIVRSLDDQEPARTLLVKRSDSSDTAVLKFLSQDSAERLLLQQVSNPHIAQFVGSGGDTEPYVLLAYYGQRDLRTYLSQGVHVSQRCSFCCSWPMHWMRFTPLGSCTATSAQSMW